MLASKSKERGARTLARCLQTHGELLGFVSIGTTPGILAWSAEEWLRIFAQAGKSAEPMTSTMRLMTRSEE